MGLVDAWDAGPSRRFGRCAGDFCPAVSLGVRQRPYDGARRHERHDPRDTKLRHGFDDLLGAVPAEDRQRESQTHPWLGVHSALGDAATSYLIGVDALDDDVRLDAIAYERDLVAGFESQHVRNLVRLLPAKDDRVRDVLLYKEAVRHAVRMSRTQSARSSLSTTPSPSATNAVSTSRSASVVMPATTREPDVRRRARRCGAMCTRTGPTRFASTTSK